MTTSGNNTPSCPAAVGPPFVTATRRFAPLLVLWLVLAGARAGHAGVGDAASSVVLVLAPGTSLADWRNNSGNGSNNASALGDGLTGTTLVGVVPTGPASQSVDDACRALAWGTRVPGPGDLPLGTVLRRAGVRVIAIENGDGLTRRVIAGPDTPGALMAPAATSAWRVARPDASSGIATDPIRLAQAVRAALQDRANNAPILVVAAFDDLFRADRYAPLALPGATREQRQNALGRLGTLLGALTEATPLTDVEGLEPDAVLVVSPRPSAEAMGRGERLGPVLLWQRGAPGAAGREHGLLTSPSTRATPGLVALPDVAATIASLLGADPQNVGTGAGRPFRASETLRDQPLPPDSAAAAYLARRVAVWAAQGRELRLLVGVPYVLAAALLLGAAVAARTSKTSAAALPALWVASVPLALLVCAPLAPVGSGRQGTVYVLALAASLAPPLLVWRGPAWLTAGRALSAVAALTILALLLDPWLGSPLLARSPLSYSVIHGARFYGVGNEVSGVFLGAGLISAAACLTAGRKGRVAFCAVAAAAVIALTVTLTLALPGLGADFGGLIAAVAGFGALFVKAQKRTRRRSAPANTVVWAVLLLAGIGSGALLLIVDAGRPASKRTHVGQALARARSRGPGAITSIAARKAATNARLLVSSPWAVLLLAQGGVSVYLRRRRIVPAGDAAFLSVSVAAATALLVNDSGAAAAATCLLFGTARQFTGVGAEGAASGNGVVAQKRA